MATSTDGPLRCSSKMFIFLGLLALFGAAQQTTGDQDLRGSFYEEIRELLADQAPKNTLQVQEQTVSPPHPREVLDWGVASPVLGQVSGVTINPQGQPVIFHRGPRVLDQSCFNDSNIFQHAAEGAIPVDTILTLNPDSGSVISAWGRNLFFLPHGIHVDWQGNTWLTDIALHQVLKFPPYSMEPSMVLGRRFEPGHGADRFCKPTAVAVASDGRFFVADGYCNSRVLAFSPRGRLLRILPQPEEFLPLRVPHSLALLEALDLLCIADRENMRVACPEAGLRRTSQVKRGVTTIQAPDMGRVFAIAPLGDQLLVAVNGPTAPSIAIQGFTLDPVGETVLDRWAPHQGFRNPHDVVVSPDGSAMYVAQIGPNRVTKFTLDNPEEAPKRAAF